MSILNILTELANTSSTKEKEAIIRREKDNELLKLVFQKAYHPHINYYIKQIPEYTRNGEVQGIAWAIRGLHDLASRKVTGHDARDFLKFVLSSMHEYDAEVVARIIQHDLRCGATDTIAAKVWPGLVPVHDVLLAHKDISGIKFPAYAQVKYDGARCHIYFDGNTVTATSRQGKVFELRGILDEEARKCMKPGDTFDGELLCQRDGRTLDRKTGNGILNKASKGTISQEEADMIIFMAWDKVDFTSTVPYSVRFKELRDAVELKGHKRIFCAEEAVVNNVEEAMEFYNKCRRHGHEGAVLKNIESKWVPKRSKDLGKMKAEETADLVVVDYEEGTGKYEGMLGALVCETADGKLRVNIGTGFSDQERADFWKNRAALKGQIVEVLYNEVISSKSSSLKSLFLPRFVAFRFDKTVANKLEELK